MFSGPAIYLSGITFSFRKGHWSSAILQLYDYHCKILLADVYSPMKGDWAIYIRPHFVRNSILFTELNCARLGRTLSTYSRTFVPLRLSSLDLFWRDNFLMSQQASGQLFHQSESLDSGLSVMFVHWWIFIYLYNCIINYFIYLFNSL